MQQKYYIQITSEPKFKIGDIVIYKGPEHSRGWSKQDTLMIHEVYTEQIDGGIEYMYEVEYLETGDYDYFTTYSIESDFRLATKTEIILYGK